MSNLGDLMVFLMKIVKKRKKNLPVVGWREWVSIPEMNIARIKAKIDTGARSSSIHAWRIVEEKRSDGLWVHFDLYPDQNSRHNPVTCVAQVVDQRGVRSSSGHQEVRYVVSMLVSLGRYQWPIEVTLADRDAMGFRLLLGRTALCQRFIVNPGRSFLLTKKSPEEILGKKVPSK